MLLEIIFAIFFIACLFFIIPFVLMMEFFLLFIIFGMGLLPYMSGNAKYFYEFIKGIEFEKSGSVQQQLTSPQVSQLDILYPPIDILNKFETATSSGVSEFESLKEQNQTLSKLRDWLLPMLMNGQVKVE